MDFFNNKDYLLFYTAHLKNLKSILNLGIISHNSSHSGGLVTEDISKPLWHTHFNKSAIVLLII